MTDPVPVSPDDSVDRPTLGIGSPADLGSRFLARFIDGLILFVVLFVVIVPIVVVAIFSGSGGFGSAFGGGFSAGSFVASLIWIAIVVGYFAVMESQWGQTVGKMAMGIRTEGPDGGKPTLEMAARRNSWYVLGIIPIIGGIAQLAMVIFIAVTISNSPEKIGWHDTFAPGTRVVKAR